MKKTGISGKMTGMASTGDNRSIFEVDNRTAQTISGVGSENITVIEKALGVTIRTHTDGLSIQGSNTAQDKAMRALGKLAQMKDVTPSAVKGILNMLSQKGGSQTISTRKLTLTARMPKQDAYIQALHNNELTFGVGPAGTGKTYLAVAHAASLLERGDIERIIISRPAVEAGERLGFLPGDLKEKVDPYLRPIYDALYDCMKPEDVEKMITSGIIEVAPLAFMRGRTLANALVILDEAQNTTSAQMKMFLTRLGENSRMVVTGDPTQVDLPRGEKSGLVEAVDLLRGVEGVAVVEFDEKDVVRHALVGRIVAKYNAADKKAEQARKATPAPAPRPPVQAPV